MGLFDWIDRTTTRGFLQLAFYDTVGVDLGVECTRECGVDGGDVALALAAGWLSLAMDSQLGRAHRNQHVAVSIFGVVVKKPTARLYFDRFNLESSGSASKSFFIHTRL